MVITATPSARASADSSITTPSVRALHRRTGTSSKAGDTAPSVLAEISRSAAVTSPPPRHTALPAPVARSPATPSATYAGSHEGAEPQFRPPGGAWGGTTNTSMSSPAPFHARSNSPTLSWYKKAAKRHSGCAALMMGTRAVKESAARSSPSHTSVLAPLTACTAAPNAALACNLSEATSMPVPPPCAPSGSDAPGRSSREAKPLR
mmetsp:Transcript_18371/g.59402  ORF Transcript_18371/g.59402 Transcript_18371/m.59402 type:complete len:206 (-) Transcript_18371:65-682(-)